MHRPSAEEFLRALLETVDDLPPDLLQRLEEVLKTDTTDRAQAIRELFEHVAGD
jgi:metal-responsive CopG/Arc/MetJ family transcriptional regulator